MSLDPEVDPQPVQDVPDDDENDEQREHDEPPDEAQNDA